MKLLIIDDEQIIRQGLMKISWESIGISQVKEADSGLAAFKLLDEYLPDIIMMDIRMPGISGLEFARIVSQKNYGCTMILLTGYGMFEYAKEAIRYGVFEYLLKPSSPDEIKSCVRRAVHHAEVLRLNKQQNELRKENESVFQSAGGSDTIRDILNYMEANYMNDISLTSLSDHTHYSAVYLSKLIKKETSYNFIALLGMIRMLKAAELLVSTSEKVYMVCEKVGIPDQRYFSQQFRKTFGKTPLEYRKELHQDMQITLSEWIRKANPPKTDWGNER